MWKEEWVEGSKQTRSGGAAERDRPRQSPFHFI
jgi:hypothetical protein